MTYTLIVLTHGEGDTLRRTVESFEKHVWPPPADALLVRDGIDVDCSWWTGQIHATGAQRGFCGAVREAWAWAAAAQTDYVFWVEHDFLFHRNIDMGEIAKVLDRNQHVVQMSLLRQPVNETEKKHGGVVLPLEAEQHVSDFLTGSKWVEHAGYWTTNPSLIPTRVFREFEWPAGPECEGKFGLNMIRLGWHFGVWGDGREQWVEHIGERTGKGY